MAHYYTFHKSKSYVRVIDAATSFEARRVLAAACKAPLTDFYAVREDLMRDNDWSIVEAAKDVGV